MPRNHTIFVVEDDEAVGEVVGHYLTAEGFTTNVFQLGEDVLKSKNAENVDCFVIDMVLPDLTGIELHKRLVENGATAPVVFMTGYGTIRAAVDAMKAGAVDVLEKPFRQEDLLNSILLGLRQDGPERQQMSLTGLSERLERLTPREREVFELIIAGEPNKLIGRRLDISHRTVEYYRARVMEKLRMDNLADLVRLSVEAGIGASNLT